jgi:hypothetical protein
MFDWLLEPVTSILGGAAQWGLDELFGGGSSAPPPVSGASSQTPTVVTLPAPSSTSSVPEYVWVGAALGAVALVIWLVVRD